MIAYIEATLVRGYTKKAAYQEFVDRDVKDPQQAVLRMEKKKEFKDLYQSIYTDDNMRLQLRMNQVKGKFVAVVEKNIDVLDEALELVKGDKGTTREKATVVRLANETIQAMSVVSGAGSAQAPGAPKIDRSGVVS